MPFMTSSKFAVHIWPVFQMYCTAFGVSGEVKRSTFMVTDETSSCFQKRVGSED